MPQFKFELESASGLLPLKTITPPVGWDTNKPTLTRDSTYHGVVRSFTVDLVFIKDGYDYLSELYSAEGVMSQCLIYIYEYNNSTHEFVLQDTGNVDFSSFKERDTEGKGMPLTITDTAFAEKIRGREDVEINYNNSVDLDNNAMSSPVYVDQEVLGMDVVSKGQSIIKEELADFTLREGVLPGSFWQPTLDYSGQVIRGQSVQSRFANVDTGFYDKETDALFIAEAPVSFQL